MINRGRRAGSAAATEVKDQAESVFEKVRGVDVIAALG